MKWTGAGGGRCSGRSTPAGPLRSAPVALFQLLAVVMRQTSGFAGRDWPLFRPKTGRVDLRIGLGILLARNSEAEGPTVSCCYPDRVLPRKSLFFRVWRVSEWLAATLEMWCPVRGCGFESHALRFTFTKENAEKAPPRGLFYLVHRSATSWHKSRETLDWSPQSVRSALDQRRSHPSG